VHSEYVLAVQIVFIKRLLPLCEVTAPATQRALETTLS
jgi:hypothetical protein